MSERYALALGALAILVVSSPAESGGHRSDLRAVVMEGDVLPDGATLQSIIAPCSDVEPFRPCLALGAKGGVAFYGTTGDGTAAIFSQRGVIVENGEVLPDGTTLDINPDTIVGGVGHSVRGLAFPGLNGTKNAMFTPQELLVTQDDVLPDGTTVSINFLGGQSIDAGARVVFHGLNAVFNQDRRLVVARQVLADGTVVNGISFFGGVTNGGFRGRVAFHGFTDNKQAIFNQRGLVARVGLQRDGNNLQSINLFGGIDINRAGEVAFHGRTDGYDAVFSQRGLLARVGKRLQDGTELEAILANGGVAIDRYGTVAFHAVTRGTRAVATQRGVVAKVGDRVRGGGMLEAIQSEGGVAINPLGEVAFHGVIDGKPALFIAR